MALVSVNPVQETPKKDTMDRILQGLQIAQGIIAPPLSIMEFMQKRKLGKLDEAKTRTEIGQNTDVAKPGEEGAFEVPGMGLRKPGPNFGMELNKLNIEEQKRQRERELRSAEPLSEQDISEIKQWYQSETGKPLPTIYVPTNVGEALNLRNTVIGRTITTPSQQFSQGMDLQRLAIAKEGEARQLREEQKKQEKEKKLEDKDLDVINQFDDAKALYTEAKKLIETHNIDVGPIAGRYPAVTESPEKTRAKQLLGQAFDAYRKAVTGTGAGQGELEMLQTRQPTEKDDQPQFFAKIKGAIEDAERRRESYLNLKEKQGKDISKFRLAPQKDNQPESQTIEVNGKKYKKVHGGWSEVRE